VINHALSHCTRRVVVDYVVTLEQCQVSKEQHTRQNASVSS
jgi:hypothetical protein